MKSSWVLAALLALPGCARREPPLPVLGQVPDFQLTAHTGQPFDRKLLEGRVWVADFIFTSCGSSCPMMSAKMRQVQSKVSPEVDLVSFTVDPEHDTPPVLADYAKRFGAQPGRWYFLTGDRARLNALSFDTFKLNSVDGSLTHSTRFVLVDRRGRIRGYYGTVDDQGLGDLLRDIGRLEREPA
ncbi:MAG TPA: SCO family protein [Bryobacteraceae bacterium]|nr:SCO family protein [Bryobacteraceae bacterium]